MTSIIIVGGGPGGYEAALVARQHGADVTLIERTGIGGSAVLSDCVPSKALVAVGDVLTTVGESGSLGITDGQLALTPSTLGTDIPRLNARIGRLAGQQSQDTRTRLESVGVRIIDGSARLLGDNRALVATGDGRDQVLVGDVILLATGARPRVLEGAAPDGERILTWEQVYSLTRLPEHLVVVGSGVTGAEFASAYQGMGVRVTLVSSREQVLPGHDTDAAKVLEQAFSARGVDVRSRSRAAAVHRTAAGVDVHLTDGSVIAASHCLMAVGSVPNTEDLGLGAAAVATDERGFISVDQVSRTSNRAIYAAGDCTGVLLLASVAAMQGRIAMWHALGQAVRPISLRTVSSNVFTTPEIATVGVTQDDVDSGVQSAVSVLLPLHSNARAKMQGVRAGFVKLFARRSTRILMGGVVVAPNASELIHPITLAVDRNLTAADLAEAFTVYPSLSGSIAEAARQLMTGAGPDRSGSP